MTKILVIEDEKFIRENLLELLESENFEVLVADNGKEGIKLAKQYQPNLILCDVMMPEMDGYGVLYDIRHHPITATTPFIFMTALAERENQRQGMELGADDYITKPCTSTELLKAVFTQLEKYSNLKRLYESKNNPANKFDDIYEDSLTKLPNRLALRDKFNQIKIGFENSNEPGNLSPKLIPIFCLKVDRFNRINDLLGYESTDLLLKELSKILTSSIANNNSIVARLNTDEFAILIEPIEQKLAVEVAQTILKNIQKSFWINNQEIFITVSIGIAFYPNDAKELEKLLRQCKQAMKQAQQKGGNCYDFYLKNFDVDTSEVLELETYLRYALEREELQLYYQPKVNLQTGKITGAEALLRWHQPQLGFISPGKFIPIAEESGLISTIGEWVLKTACQQKKSWQNLGFDSINIAVNLSGSQFNQLDLKAKLVKIILDAGLDPKHIELELTENILLENVEGVGKKLRELKALGLLIAVDDFGTGYSSLSYLQQFPFDILKIDQCFVRNIDNNTTNQAITNAVISMAHQLNLKVIAEGIETESELAFLCKNGCDEMQGYLFSRPLPVEEFEQLLLSNKCLQIDI